MKADQDSRVRRGRQPRLALPLSVEDAAYLAGIIDADGTIGFYKKSRNGGSQYVLQLGVSNTRNDLLAWIQATTGVGLVAVNRPATDRLKACYHWIAQNRGAWSVLQQTMPYMRVKNDRAALARNALDAMAAHDLEKVEEFRVLFTLANQRGPA